MNDQRTAALEKRVTELETLVNSLIETIEIHSKIIDTLQKAAIQQAESK